MSQPQTAILTHDPDDKRRYSLDWAALLASGDTLASVACAVVEGTATISATSSGGGTTASGLSLSGTTSTVWVLSATAGTVRLRWRATTAAGEQLDCTTALGVAEQ